MEFLGLSPLLLLLGVGFLWPSLSELISLYKLDASSLASSSISLLCLELVRFLEWDDSVSSTITLLSLVSGERSGFGKVDFQVKSPSWGGESFKIRGIQMYAPYSPSQKKSDESRYLGP